MVERAEAHRVRRNRQVRIGAVSAAVLLLVVVTWVFIANRGSSPTTATPAAAATSAPCSWNPLVDPSASPAPTLPAGFKNVGTPPAMVPSTGYQVMTVDTNLGPVKVQMDLAKTPCTAASISYLAGKKFYDGGGCNALSTTLFALVCGDPKGADFGGPTYSYANENLPTTRLPAYTVGDVAMHNADQQDQPSQGTNGARFFFVYQEGNIPAQFTLLGRVIQGWDVVQKVAAGGAGAEGKPTTALTIKTVTVSAPSATAAPEPLYSAPATSAAPSPSAPAASATPSANPSS
jgi:peptidyl-prolyl cis-trans isomerase B (cyclophilin B)